MSASDITNNKKTYNIETPDIVLGNYQPTCDGFLFGGWYSDEDCTEGKQVTVVPKGSTGDMTVYAKWIPVPYNVKWYYNYPEISLLK